MEHIFRQSLPVVHMKSSAKNEKRELERETQTGNLLFKMDDNVEASIWEMVSLFACVFNSNTLCSQSHYM